MTSTAVPPGYLEADPDGIGAAVAAEAIAELERELAEESQKRQAGAANSDDGGSGDPVRYWLFAEVYRKAGDKVRAVEYYRRYLESAVIGEHVLEATLWLERLIGAGASVGPVMSALPVDGRSAPAKDRQTGQELRPLLLPLAGTAIVAGLSLDLGPGSATNGKLDAMDFAPIAFYALGAVLGLFWAF